VVEYSNYLRRPFRWAHVFWAVLGGSVCILLVVAGGGHPPPMIFVPVVVAVWVTGHIALWGVRWLAFKGQVWTSRAGGATVSWPPGLIVALIGTGGASSVGLLQVVVTALLRKTYPFHDALWTVMMIIWLVHGACFAGLLLRRAWSQWTASLLSAGWALLLAWQIVETVVRGYRINPMEILIAIGLASLLMSLGYHLLASKRIRAFLGSG